MVMAIIAIASFIACGFVYAKRQQEKHEMLIRTAESFAASQNIKIAGQALKAMLDFTIPDDARINKIAVSREGERVFEGSYEDFSNLFLGNGVYDAEIYCDVEGNTSAEDGTVLTIKGSETFALRLNLNIPTEFHLSRTDMVQGSAVAIIGTNVSGEVSATAPGVIDTINFTVDNKGNAQALLSSTFRCSPGTYECIVDYNGEDIVLAFTVTEGKYSVQHLTISTSTAAATVGNDNAMADYNGMIAETNLIWTPERYYEDSFIFTDIPTEVPPHRGTSAWILRRTKGLPFLLQLPVR